MNITDYDKDYNEDLFKTYTDNIFVQIYTSIMTKEIEKIKHFVSEDIFKNLEEKITSLGSNIQMYDELNVKSTNILNKKIENNKIVIEVELISRYMDYIINEDGNKVSGDNERRIEKRNLLTFEKNINSLDNMNAAKCPGCGSNIDVNANGKCFYCGATYDLEKRNYILTKLN